jgi:superfamily II DNA or RNA helicase
MANSGPRARPRKKGKKQKPRLSRTHKPEDMSLEQWQIELRRQFGQEQKFRLVNEGDDPVFSTFAVTNPQSGNTYRIRIRGAGVGDNTCSCPDFGTNTLGTCKHIEFTLARLTRKRELRQRLKAGHQPPHSEIFLQYGSRREVRFRPGSECPVELARLSSRYFDADGALRCSMVERFETFLAEAGNLEPDLECGDDVLAFVAELRDGKRRERLVEKAFPQGSESDAFKGIVKADLYSYQREGALFAARAGRVLIGDEMGLGKTIQAITAAEIMARLFGVERVLIVCPTSLKHQWQREIERFIGRPTGVVSGLRPQREKHFAEPGHFFKITNYDTVHTDLELIEAWSPDLVILDEAQRIKNWTTRVARSVKKITSPYAIVLTGTPLENRLEELISIVQFVDLYRLGPTFRMLHEHQIRDEVGKVVGYRDLDRIGQTLAPILIRRQKEQVLEQLPGRIDNTFFVPMTEQQRQIHTENQEIVARIVAKWRRYKFLSEADQRRLMTALQRMRMVCDSTHLIEPQIDHGHKADEAVTLFDELLERPNTKVVVFSQWLGMHELILRRIGSRNWNPAFFHGGLSGEQRKKLIDQFRDDSNCRLFLSTDAGGVGLNLQHACVVVNMDLPWNPAVLEQRIGRVHRMGQKEAVRVVNFVARGTIEEGMLGVLKFKKSLFAGVLDGGEKEVFLGGTRLTKFMETVEAATTAIPTGVQEEEAGESAAAADERKPPAPSKTEGGNCKAPAAPKPPEQPLAPPPAPAAPWQGLLQAGMAILQHLVAPPAGANGQSGGQGGMPGRVCRDEQTGESYLRLPVPPTEVLEQAVGALQQLLSSMRK